MKRCRLFFVFSILLAFSTGSHVGAAGQTRDTIRLTSGNWQPMMSENGPHHGFVSHIITEAFALGDVEVEYHYFSWAKAFELAKEAEFDGSAAWWDRPERHEDFIYSDPIAPSKVVFFHSKGSRFDWRNFEDLKGLKVGATEGYNYSKRFNEAEAAGIINVEIAPDDKTNLKKLLGGQIDLFPGDLMVTYTQIRDSFTLQEAAQLTHNSKAIFEEPIFLIFRKNVPGNKQMRERFNEGLSILKESGRYDQIITDSMAGKYDAK